MASKLLALIKKNFKLLLRTKSSALIVILGPLLLILLVSIAFNTANIYGIRIGAYSDSYSPLTESILKELEKEQFSVIKTESQESCINSIRNGIFHVCAIFPPGMNIQDGGEILFYVDNTRTNLVYLVLDRISQEVGAKSKELSAQLAKSIVDVLDFTSKELNDKKQLVKGITDSSSQSESILNKISQELSSVDLSFNIANLGFGSLESEIANQERDVNRTLTGLRSALTNLRSNVESLGDRLLKLNEIRERSIGDITSLAQNTIATLSFINSLQTSIDEIVKDIENVKVTSVQKIISPINTRIEPIATQAEHLNYLFPTLLALIVMFVSILLASTLEVREKSARVYFKNFITPTSDFTFLLGNFLTNIFIVILQLLVLLGVASFYFKDLIKILPLLSLVLLLITSIFILLGMTIGNIFKSEETSTLAAISIGFILLFFSSTILPIETLPNLIEKIASYNPLYISERVINSILLFQSTLQSVLPQLTILVAYFLALSIIAIFTKKATKGY